MNPTLRPMTAAEILAATIKHHRQALHLSQAELADAAGMTQATVANLEAAKANPTIKSLDKIAKGLRLQLVLSFEKPVKPIRM